MGMWMEGVGSWNGSVMEQSREQWHPAYSHYATQFLHRWGSLLNMTPAADIRAMQVGGVLDMGFEVWEGVGGQCRWGSLLSMTQAADETRHAGW